MNYVTLEVVFVDCLRIETINQVKDGCIDKPVKNLTHVPWKTGAGEVLCHVDTNIELLYVNHVSVDKDKM